MHAKSTASSLKSVMTLTWEIRPAADSDQDLVGRNLLAVNLDSVRIHKLGTRLDDFNASVAQHALINPIQPENLRILLLHKARPVHCAGLLLDIPSIGSHVLEVVRVLGAVNHELLGDAAHIHALIRGVQGLGSRMHDTHCDSVRIVENPHSDHRRDWQG